MLGDEAFATGTVDPAPIGQPFPERERGHISGNGGMPFLIPALLADDRPTIEADLPGMPYRNNLRLSLSDKLHNHRCQRYSYASI